MGATVICQILIVIFCKLNKTKQEAKVLTCKAKSIRVILHFQPRNTGVRRAVFASCSPNQLLRIQPQSKTKKTLKKNPENAKVIYLNQISGVHRKNNTVRKKDKCITKL
jgi:hypothetical protein